MFFSLLLLITNYRDLDAVYGHFDRKGDRLGFFIVGVRASLPQTEGPF
jgi:hypothetical protein